MSYTKNTDWLTVMAIAVILAACGSSEDEFAEEDLVVRDSVVCYSLFAEPLRYPVETKSSFERKDSLLRAARKNYETDSRDLDNIIWYGRRLGYLAEYPRAMSVYTRGLHLHPESPEIYRHRGHRYITLRKFEEAANDLSMASVLARGKEVQIEPDGIPNKMNKPLSTLQFNIWYHLGLARYLQGDYELARIAYDSCMAYSTNDDLLCATTEWYFLTAMRLGDEELATSLLEPISSNMEIIENEAYHKLLLLYKGQKSVEEVLPDADEEQQLATIGYGVANYLVYSGDTLRAQRTIDSILSTDAWPSFGYIAAEADKAVGRW